MDKNKLKLFGTCRKPHGIKGALHLHLINDEQSILSKGMKIYAYPLDSSSSLPPEGKSLTLSQITFGHKVMAFFQEVPDRTAAEQVTPFEFYLAREDFPEPDEDEFYLADAIGFEVVEEATDQVLGKVHSFYHNGAHDVMVVRPQSGAVLEVPFVDAFIKLVELEQEKVFIIRPLF